MISPYRLSATQVISDWRLAIADLRKPLEQPEGSNQSAIGNRQSAMFLPVADGLHI
jgi:hypothetical protein